MAIIVKLDMVMAEKGVKLIDLMAFAHATPSSLSMLKNNKARAIRFSTLENICRTLRCQPGDILEYRDFEEEDRKDKIRKKYMSL